MGTNKLQYDHTTNEPYIWLVKVPHTALAYFNYTDAQRAYNLRKENYLRDPDYKVILSREYNKFKEAITVVKDVSSNSCFDIMLQRITIK